ncbi:MAG TPA: pilus assembly protein TadG-related protein [Anaerolineales bacterium]|nr:pilus assembly protein TadG-related protein [Anaerolineales bacterium]
MTFKTTEKGQALIMIAFAAIGLFAFAALAIDGSLAFSDRRHAQNAADTSALAAALAKINAQDWDAAARARATSNGYTDDGRTKVYVHLCSDTSLVTDEGIPLTCRGLPTGAKPEEYIHVYIKSIVSTYFTRVIGRSEVINHVEAVAHAIPGYRNSTFGGQALVAVNKDACPAFSYGGNGKIAVTGSGIFVNSRCTSTNPALDSQSANAYLTVPCYNVVGGVDANNLTSTGPCTSLSPQPSLFMSNPLANFPAPKIDCASYPLGTFSSTGTTTTITAGRYNPTNSHNSFPDTAWQPNVIMEPGIYCIDLAGHDFSLSGGQTLTGSNVLIYMQTGGVSWQTKGIHLSAMQGVNPDYDGLLLYLPPENHSIVSITGGGDSSFVGTILAPGSQVKIAGGSDTGTVGVLENQIISDTISLTGGADLIINFNAKVQWKPPVPPEIQVTQ